MPVVINSLGGRHTHTHTETYRRPHKNNFKKSGMRWPMAGAHLVNKLVTFSSLYVTGFMKTDPNHTFGISKITNLKYLTHCESLVLGYSHVNLLYSCNSYLASGLS